MTLKGGKSSLEILHKGKFKFDGNKIKVDTKHTSKGAHTITVEHDRKFGDVKTDLKNELTFTSANRQIANVFKASSKLKDLGVRWTFTADCGEGKCDITNHLIKKIAKGFVVSSYLTYDYTAKARKDLGVGFWWSGEAGKTGLTFVCDPSAEGCGQWNWRALFKAGHDTNIGFDYNFNCCADPSPELKIGFSHKASKSTSWKAKVSHTGYVETGFKTKLNKEWTLLGSTGFDSSALNGKAESVFGLALEASL